MKKIVIGTVAAAFTATTLIAGDLSEPVVTEVDEPEAASSSAPWLWLLLLGAGVVLLTQDDNSVPADNDG